MFNQLIRRFYLCGQEKNKTCSDQKPRWDEALWISPNPRVHLTFQERGVPELVEQKGPRGTGMPVRPWRCCCRREPQRWAGGTGGPTGRVCLGFRFGNVLTVHLNFFVRLSPWRGASEECCKQGIMRYELRNKCRLEITKRFLSL